MLEQKIVHHQTDVGGEELAALLPCIFGCGLRLHRWTRQGQDAVITWRAISVFFHHIPALLHDVDGRSVGRRASDAQLFQTLHQTCFRVTRRVFAEPLGRHNGLARHGLSLRHGGKHVFGRLIGTFLVVGAFEVKLQKPFKRDDFSSRHKRLFSS